MHETVFSAALKPCSMFEMHHKLTRLTAATETKSKTRFYWLRTYVDCWNQVDTRLSQL